MTRNAIINATIALASVLRSETGKHFMHDFVTSACAEATEDHFYHEKWSAHVRPTWRRLHEAESLNYLRGATGAYRSVVVSLVLEAGDGFGRREAVRVVNEEADQLCGHDFPQMEYAEKYYRQ